MPGVCQQAQHEGPIFFAALNGPSEMQTPFFCQLFSKRMANIYLEYKRVRRNDTRFGGQGSESCFNKGSMWVLFQIYFVLLCFEISVILRYLMRILKSLYFKKYSIYSVIRRSVAFYLPFINIKRSRKLPGSLFFWNSRQNTAMLRMVDAFYFQECPLLAAALNLKVFCCSLRDFICWSRTMH